MRGKWGGVGGRCQATHSLVSISRIPGQDRHDPVTGRSVPELAGNTLKLHHCAGGRAGSISLLKRIPRIPSEVPGTSRWALLIRANCHWDPEDILWIAPTQLFNSLQVYPPLTASATPTTLQIKRMAESKATVPSAAVGASSPIAGGEEAEAAQLPAPNPTAQLQIDASRPQNPLHSSILTHHSQMRNPT
jgi:hypothetical protein